ncbi:MAG: VWA domain-containing protein [Methyloprofundus sp.]|nr:VWA domain-containing protein [Methyloprofundus sp.]
MIASEFHLIRPYWLLAFLPLIAYVFLHIKHKLRQGNWASVCDPELLPFILEEKQQQQSRLPLLASTLASILCIIALAGPTWERIPTPVFRNASALVIALDLSRSMDAADIKPSRLARARFKIADLLKQRKDGQSALIVYANSAFTVTPLTNDTETINNQLAALSSDLMPAQGSNSIAAIDLAVQLFKNAGLQKGQILLVTDDDTLSEVDIPNGYQLSILAVATTEGAPIKVAKGGFLKDASGNIVVPKLESRALRQAVSAGGLYQQSTSSDQDIERLSAHFNQAAERGTATENDLLLENWVEAGVWLLFPLLLLSAFSFRRGLLSVLFIILLPFPNDSVALEWQDLWQTKEQQAQQQYLDGNYQQAAETFTDPAWRAAAQYKAETPIEKDQEMSTATTDTGFYNQGNVHAKSGQLDKAKEAYEQALKLNSNNEDAKFNKELVEKELEKQKQQQDKQQDKDKQQEDQEKQPSEDQQSGEGEPSEENSEQQQDQQPENSEQENSEQQQEEQEQQQAEETEQETEESEQEKAQQAKMSEAEQQEQSEQDQANQQWLKRIPDDPSGLLRRKFKYQYGRQKQRQNSQQAW